MPAAGILGGAGATARTRGRTALMTLAYVTGLATVYSALGLVAGLTGTLFGAISSSPWAYFAMANLLLLAVTAHESHPSSRTPSPCRSVQLPPPPSSSL